MQISSVSMHGLPFVYPPHAPGLLISPPDFPFDVIKQSLSLMIRICMQVPLGKLIRPLRYPLDREEIKHSSFSGSGKQMWRVMLNQGVSLLWLVTQRHDRRFNFTELITKRDFAWRLRNDASALCEVYWKLPEERAWREVQQIVNSSCEIVMNLQSRSVNR